MKEEVQKLVEILKQNEITHYLPENENFAKFATNFSKSIYHKNPKTKPELVIIPTDENQVSQIIKLTKNLNLNLPIGVKNGGHSIDEYSTPSGGIVLSMNKFKQIDINKEEKIIKIGGGVNNGELNDALRGTGLWIPLADGATVGFTGYMLHGGISHQYVKLTGLASDLLLSATIILSNGEIIEADEKNYADLFSALKGAGSVLGVVTNLTLKLLNAENLSHDYFVYPYSDETLKKSIIFTNNISEKIEEVMVSSFYWNMGAKNDKVEITISYNNINNNIEQIKKEVLNELKNNIQIKMIEQKQNLQPYDRLMHVQKYVEEDAIFLFSNILDMRFCIYSQGFKYEFLTEKNVDQLIKNYHNFQIEKKYQGGYYHSLGGKVKGSDSWTGLKNADIFCMVMDFCSAADLEKIQQYFEQSKKFSRNTDGIFPDIYANLDIIPNNFENKKVFEDFVGGAENIQKLIDLKTKYDPENFFRGHYYQEVFKELVPHEKNSIEE